MHCHRRQPANIASSACKPPCSRGQTRAEHLRKAEGGARLRHTSACPESRPSSRRVPMQSVPCRRIEVACLNQCHDRASRIAQDPTTRNQQQRRRSLELSAAWTTASAADVAMWQLCKQQDNMYWARSCALHPKHERPISTEAAHTWVVTTPLPREVPCIACLCLIFYSKPHRDCTQPLLTPLHTCSLALSAPPTQGCKPATNPTNRSQLLQHSSTDVLWCIPTAAGARSWPWRPHCPPDWGVPKPADSWTR